MSSSSTGTLVGGRLQGLSGRSSAAASHPSSGIKYGELGGMLAFGRVSSIASSLISFWFTSMGVATGVGNETPRGALRCVVSGCDNGIVCTCGCVGDTVLLVRVGKTGAVGT